MEYQIHDSRVTNHCRNFALAANYDINAAVLIHYEKPYKDRLKFFKKFGLINVGSNKVHVTIIASIENWDWRDEIMADWPENFDVTLLEMGSKHPVPKIHGYYLWLEENGISARWHLRVDDDSLTDVSGLLAYVDNRFGDLPVHVMTAPHDVQSPAHRLVSILRKLEIPMTNYMREYESSITSRQAMLDVFACQEAMRFIRESSRTVTIYGDQGLAFAMHIAKVPVAKNDFSSKDFERTNLSITGGHLYHIHYVNWNHGEFVELLNALLYGADLAITPDLLNAFINIPLEFGRNIGLKLCALRLLPDGNIEGYNHENESKWRIGRSSLMFQRSNGLVTTIFNRCIVCGSKTWLVGPHLYKPTNHYLRVDREL